MSQQTTYNLPVVICHLLTGWVIWENFREIWKIIVAEESVKTSREKSVTYGLKHRLVNILSAFGKIIMTSKKFMSKHLERRGNAWMKPDSCKNWFEKI